MAYTFQWRPVLHSLPEMLWGALVSLEIAALAMAIGTVFALLLALAKRSGGKTLSGLADIWIEIARNTPACFRST